MEGNDDRARMKLDPLAFLEAEYAAVLAQSRPKSPNAEDEQCDNNAQSGSKSTANDDDDDDDDASTSEASDDRYALLPSSPHASDDEEEEDSALGHHDEIELVEDDAAAAASTPSAVMDAAKRETIMQSMRQFSLPPPSWAKKANLSDDELVDLVQRQLGTATKQQRAV